MPISVAARWINAAAFGPAFSCPLRRPRRQCAIGCSALISERVTSSSSDRLLIVASSHRLFGGASVRHGGVLEQRMRGVCYTWLAVTRVRTSGAGVGLRRNLADGADTGNAGVPDHLVVGGLNNGEHIARRHERPAMLARLAHRAVAQTCKAVLPELTTELARRGIVVRIVDRVGQRDGRGIQQACLVELARQSAKDETLEVQTHNAGPVQLLVMAHFGQGRFHAVGQVEHAVTAIAETRA